MAGVNKSKKKHGITYKDDPGAKAAELESFLFGAKSEEASHIFVRNDDDDDSTIAELLKKVSVKTAAVCNPSRALYCSKRWGSSLCMIQ